MISWHKKLDKATSNRRKITILHNYQALYLQNKEIHSIMMLIFVTIIKRENIMIGIVLVTHGRLAEEFVDALVHIHGPQPALETVCIGPDDDLIEQQQNIINAAERANVDDEGVVILTDMFGGTPSNLAISIMDQINAEVIAGVNLPILVKLASIRDKTELRQACLEAQEAGRKYISLASELLKQGS